jgi:hypothetical protein
MHQYGRYQSNNLGSRHNVTNSTVDCWPGLKREGLRDVSTTHPLGSHQLILVQGELLHAVREPVLGRADMGVGGQWSEVTSVWPDHLPIFRIISTRFCSIRNVQVVHWVGSCKLLLSLAQVSVSASALLHTLKSLNPVTWVLSLYNISRAFTAARRTAPSCVLEVQSFQGIRECKTSTFSLEALHMLCCTAVLIVHNGMAAWYMPKEQSKWREAAVLLV